ncbi:13957_t:CDS:10, partial [Acaulospora morrowiae]
TNNNANDSLADISIGNSASSASDNVTIPNSANANSTIQNPNASPPRNQNRHLSQNQDPLATPRSFFRNNTASVTPSLLSSPPPPFKLPFLSSKDSQTIGNDIFESPLLAGSPFCDARTSIGSTSSVLGTLRLEDKLRLWRQDAYVKNLYETAAFWGSKVMTMTGDSNDVYWLALVYYNMGQYVRAQKLIKNLIDSSVICRYLAAKCCIKMEKYQEAIDVLGEENPFSKKDYGSVVKNTEGGLQLEASMCYLRGLAYSQQTNLDNAKKCFKEALELDVKCYEAFHELVNNHMLSSKEEWEFINSLKFEEQLESEEAYFIKMNYLSMLKKYEHLPEIQEARSELEERFRLESNADVLMSHADELYAQCRFKECYEITTKILEQDMHNQDCLPTHLVCLHELREKNKLFLLVHDLVEVSPERPVTWFGIGCYNYLIGQNDEARRYFIKASTMDSHYGPAWIGFGHTFAAESEHDQAITAYSTAAKLFPGSHLPPLFIGMQHLQANNLLSSEEYLLTSYNICKGDPLILNELGVLCFRKLNYAQSVEYFKKALALVEETKCRPQIWETTWMNLGHAFRMLGELDAAETYFKKVISMSPPNQSALTALGYIYHVKEDFEEAIMYYHEALGIRPSDPITQDLLGLCLEEMINGSKSDKVESS